MTKPSLHCQILERRGEIRRQKEDWNGLDFAEICGAPTRLCIHFLGKAPKDLQPANFRIKGGERITGIRVTGLEWSCEDDPELDDCLTLLLDRAGDFSNYEVCLEAVDERGCPTGEPYPGIDGRYACVCFQFHNDCATDLDCSEPADCPAPSEKSIEINYMAKDYASFRQLILDRLAVTMPDWQDREVPDMGIVLSEILAYSADRLSYFQDAVATEAYLHTARQRISVRRHAKLVDYHLHEGVNARTWVTIWTANDENLDLSGVAFITRLETVLPQAPRLLTWDALAEVPRSKYEVFEPLVPMEKTTIRLLTAHNEIRFYTWGNQVCCLPEGSTAAVLCDGDMVAEAIVDQDHGETPAKPVRQLKLAPGDVLIFEEIRSPKTGSENDRNPSHRHAVRLTSVRKTSDPLYRKLLLEITWSIEDALPFPLTLSAVGPAPDCKLLDPVSVARGNVILADHGRRQPQPEDLGCVPLDTISQPCCGPDLAAEPLKTAGRFQPVLAKGPVVYAQLASHAAPANQSLRQDPRKALPAIEITSHWDEACDPFPQQQSTPDPKVPCDYETPEGENGAPTQAVTPQDQPPVITTWMPVGSLLSSTADQHHVVAEADGRGRLHLRFGNGVMGYHPEVGHHFWAATRLGGGSAGNIGTESLWHLVTHNLLDGVDFRPRNPLPAIGGQDPEDKDDAVRFAPHAFRRFPLRAVTAADYAALVQREFAHKVQRASATLRWNGSWQEILLAIDSWGPEPASEKLLAEIHQFLMAYRRVGHDLQITAARRVPLEIALHICVEPGALRGHVKAALLRVFSNRDLGQDKGFFHPDRLSFGEGIRLSNLVATAMQVPGVENAVVLRLNRLFEPPNGELQNGFLALGPLEVAQLDNDPNFPEHGKFFFDLRGGR